MKLIKRYRSRKNEVFLKEESGILSVVKVYADIDIAVKAYELMNRLKEKINIPAITAFSANRLTMEYIEGNTLLDEYEQADEIKAAQLAEMLYNYLESLDLEGFVQTDSNFTNYLVSGREIIGIDFDEVLEKGSFSFFDCLLDIILYAKTYDGIDEKVKQSFSARLLELSGISEEDLVIYSKRAYQRLVARRGIC